MLESRWGRRLGSVMAAATALMAVVATATGAPGMEGRPPPACDGRPAAGPGSGAWYRLDPVLRDGTLTGQRLAVGRAGGAGWTVDLGPESFVAEPIGGLVVVGTDDGRRSVVSVIDAGRGCRWPATTSDDIIRRAILAPDGLSWYEHRLRRSDRRDLGIWHRPLGADDARRVLEPVEADARFGMTWSTRLRWSADGSSLAVQSCGEVACRTRVLELSSGRVRQVADPHLGVLVGLSGERLVVRAACRGLPCPISVVDLGHGRTKVLADAAGAARLAADRGGHVSLVYESEPGGRRLRRIDLDGRSAAGLVIEGTGLQLVTEDAEAGAEVADGTLLLGPEGRVGPAGPAGTVLPLPAFEPAVPDGVSP